MSMFLEKLALGNMHNTVEISLTQAFIDICLIDLLRISYNSHPLLFKFCSQSFFSLFEAISVIQSQSLRQIGSNAIVMPLP